MSWVKNKVRLVGEPKDEHILKGCFALELRSKQHPAADIEPNFIQKYLNPQGKT